VKFWANAACSVTNTKGLHCPFEHQMIWGPMMLIPCCDPTLNLMTCGFSPLTAVASADNSGILCCCSNGLWQDPSAVWIMSVIPTALDPPAGIP
jgi:hypothetical protein